jgi:hypothetical protein
MRLKSNSRRMEVPDVNLYFKNKIFLSHDRCHGDIRFRLSTDSRGENPMDTLALQFEP